MKPIQNIFSMIVCTLLLTSLPAFATEQNFPLIEAQAKMATTTYEKADDIASLLQKEGQVLVHQSMIPANKVSYFLSMAQGVQSIAIRGTANLDNVMLDLDVALQPDALLNIKLHQGFATAARSVYDDIKPYLDPHKPVHLTGHSLGGAIAVVLGMYLQNDNFHVAQIITFGQPKVTNVEGAKVFPDLPLIRVVTALDIVPLVPPISPLQIRDLDIYWHMGVEVILLGEHQYTQTRGAKSALRATKFTSSIPDEGNLHAHKMTTYIELLTDLQQQHQQIPYEMEINLWGFSIN